MDDASSDEDIDILLNEPNYMSLVDSSRWSTTASINMNTKGALIQVLIMDEVIGKRQIQMENLRKGLTKFSGFFSLCQKYPEKCKSLFVYTDQDVTYDVFLKLMAPVFDNTGTHGDILTWFTDYLKEREREKTGAKLMCIY